MNQLMKHDPVVSDYANPYKPAITTGPKFKLGIMDHSCSYNLANTGIDTQPLRVDPATATDPWWGCAQGNSISNREGDSIAILSTEIRMSILMDGKTVSGGSFNLEHQNINHIIYLIQDVSSNKAQAPVSDILEVSSIIAGANASESFHAHMVVENTNRFKTLKRKVFTTPNQHVVYYNGSDTNTYSTTQNIYKQLHWYIKHKPGVRVDFDPASTTGSSTDVLNNALIILYGNDQTNDTGRRRNVNMTVDVRCRFIR